MARYGRDYGIRLVDRDLLKDTRWALDRPDHEPARNHRGPPPASQAGPEMPPPPGYDFGPRGSPGAQRPARDSQPAHDPRRPMEPSYDAGYRGDRPPHDSFGRRRY